MVNLIKGECYWKSPRITFSQNCVFFFYKELKINEKTSDYKKDSKSFIIYGNLFFNDLNILVENINFKSLEKDFFRLTDTGDILNNLNNKNNISIPNCIYLNNNLYITYFTKDNKIKLCNTKEDIIIDNINNSNLKSQIDFFEFNKENYLLLPVTENNMLTYYYAKFNKNNISDKKKINFENITSYNNCEQLFYVKDYNIFVGTFYNEKNRGILIINLNNNLELVDHKEIIKKDKTDILTIGGINIIDRHSFLININKELYNYYLEK
jgi:hypothetical protein